MTQRKTLSGKRIVITGAARGIGFATARDAIERGARVALLDRDDLAVKQAAEQLGPAACAFVADVTDADQLRAAIDAAAVALGGLDVVFANAGVAPKMVTVSGTSTAEFDRVIGINLRGAWNTVQAGLPHLRATSGQIVLVASVYSYLNGAFCAPYAVSKAGVEALGRTLHVELATEGIAVTTAHFGFVDTDLVHGSFDGDPLTEQLEALFPGALTKRISPERAAAELLRGVERRKSWIVAPAPWLPLDWLRGISGPLGDAALARLPKFRQLVAQARAREDAAEGTA
ncbi:SDR family NAD(P)-dependent oxidoreductase [Nocardia sp. XZ_19_385]|uniref:SDR family NAD(P)-dependent oxidoreductase n=1 Tax=Nocardia sp. XZ_19_385 TaxID=2769488 RepID=UPI00188E3B94|nr:SDR family NAD(P)-dependent oxidoreductase [Nocardia sp. XZ_19_385]